MYLLNLFSFAFDNNDLFQMMIIRLFHCINRLPFFGIRQKKTIMVGYALTLSISINPVKNNNYMILYRQVLRYHIQC